MESCYVVFYDREYGYAMIKSRAEDDHRFPGGVCKDGETRRDCLFRAAREVGWEFYNIAHEPFYEELLGDERVLYFKACGEFRILSRYKEQSIVSPTFVKKELVQKQYRLGLSSYVHDLCGR